MAPKRKTSRRHFLSGRSAIQAISDLPTLDPSAAEADLEHAPKEAATERESSYLVQVGRDAMACEFQVYLNAGQHAAATEAALEALDLVESLEDQMTVYRDHSEISQINRIAADRALEVQPDLFQLLQQAADLYEATQGAFDITAGPLWEAWGFYRRQGRFPGEEEISEALAAIGTRWMRLDAETSTVQFTRPGLRLNLGAIGKGYALDRAAGHLQDRGVDDFLIHGGQSSILARGSRLEEDADGWWIAIRHPLRQDQRLLEVRLRDQALGTSGSGNQFFHFAGKRYGHVIDPRTGFPADKMLSATVLTPRAALADALATAFFVMGVDESIEFCESHPELAAILICPGPRAGSVTIHTHGLDDADWRDLSQSHPQRV